MSYVDHLLYIDPGSGSLIFQALLSSLLTGLIFFKKIGLYVRTIFGRRKMVHDQESNNLK